MDAALFLLSIIVLFLSLSSTYHTVHEGFVGVYWRGGALLHSITEPGFHFKLPFITSVELVQISVQTDSVSQIPCGTSGGVLLQFGKVEVVNRLKTDFVYDTIKNYTVHYDKTWIFDKIHHEINQFCSSHTLQEVYIDLFESLDEYLATALQRDCNKWAPGIEIIAVRVTKPWIPDAIRKNYEQMEAEKTKLLIANEIQRVVEKESETEKLKAIIEADQVAQVSKIGMKQAIAEKESMQRISKIEDQMHSNRQKAHADADYYRTAKESEANAAKLTPEFLEYSRIISLANNTKVYFGEKIPSTFLQNGNP